MTTKPTPKQLEVTQYMCQGWEMVVYLGFIKIPSRVVLRNLETGKENKLRKDIREKMWLRRLIEYVPRKEQTCSGRFSTLRLTDAGKAIAKEKGWIQ